MSVVALTPNEQSMLDGAQGAGTALAMRIVVRLAQAMGANELLAISGAHIDSCLYHGQSGLDFVHRLASGGATVQVPTTLNVSSLDLLHPELYQGDADQAAASRELMHAYVSLGCEPTWTCAPYQREQRPARGQHVAWAESNAIVFANSVLGARTHRYSDFIDIAAAVTGRVPDAGLHRAENRVATTVVDVGDLSDRLLATDAVYPVIGYLVGRYCGSSIPAIVGLPAGVEEHNLKALGAAAASSGSLAMFHAVGVTPEAPTLEAACGGGGVPEDDGRRRITAAECRRARDELSVRIGGEPGSSLATVSLGTPHYSVREIGILTELLAGRTVHPSVDVYVSTGREVLTEAGLRGWVEPLIGAGVALRLVSLQQGDGVTLHSTAQPGNPLSALPLDRHRRSDGTAQILRHRGSVRGDLGPVEDHRAIHVHNRPTSGLQPVGGISQHGDAVAPGPTLVGVGE